MVQLSQFWIYTYRNQRQTVGTREHPINCSTASHAHSGCKHRAASVFLCCGHLKAQELLLVDASSHPQTIKGKHLGYGVCSGARRDIPGTKWWGKYGETFVILAKVKCVGKRDEKADIFQKVVNDLIGGTRGGSGQGIFHLIDGKKRWSKSNHWGSLSREQSKEGRYYSQHKHAHVCILECAHGYTQTCRHTHEHRHKCVHEHTCVHTATYMHKHLNVYLCIHTSYIHAQRHMYSHIYRGTHVCTSHTHTCTEAPLHTH